VYSTADHETILEPEITLAFQRGKYFMLYNDNSPIAEACYCAVDELADALLDSVKQYRDIDHVVRTIDAMFSLADISESILAHSDGLDEDAYKSVIPTILPSRPSNSNSKFDGYEAYFRMLAHAASRSPRFKRALQDYSSWLQAPKKGPQNYVEQVLKLVLEIEECPTAVWLQ
jgi:hypothetical protein